MGLIYWLSKNIYLPPTVDKIRNSEEENIRKDSYISEGSIEVRMYEDDTGAQEDHKLNSKSEQSLSKDLNIYDNGLNLYHNDSEDPDSPQASGKGHGAKETIRNSKNKKSDKQATSSSKDDKKTKNAKRKITTVKTVIKKKLSK